MISKKIQQKAETLVQSIFKKMRNTESHQRVKDDPWGHILSLLKEIDERMSGDSRYSAMLDSTVERASYADSIKEVRAELGEPVYKVAAKNRKKEIAMISQAMGKKLRKIVAAVGKSTGNSNMQRIAKEADAEALLYSLIDNLEKEVTGEYRATAMLQSALARCFFRERVEKAKQLLETEEATA